MTKIYWNEKVIDNTIKKRRDWFQRYSNKFEALLDVEKEIKEFDSHVVLFGEYSKELKTIDQKISESSRKEQSEINYKALFIK